MWDLVRAVHLIAMAFFVGGQLMLGLVVVPVARRAQDRSALRAVARRFGLGSLMALAVLAGTGSAMATHYQHWSDPDLEAKLALVGAVIALVLWHMRRPGSKLPEVLILLVSLAIVALGVVIAH